MVENIIEAMVDAVLVIDAEGRITLANTAASGITGYTREQLKLMPVVRLLIDESSGMRTVVRRRIEDGDVMRRDAAWLIAKDGTRVPVSVTGSPVIDANAALQGIVLVARDVREVRQLLADKESEIARRRAVEEELRVSKASVEDQLDQARKHLYTAERRATLGTLAAGVGHELKNIAQMQILAVEELATVLQHNEHPKRYIDEYLPNLFTVYDHITAHSQRLIKLAKPGPDRMDPLDLNDAIADIVAMLRGAGKIRGNVIALELAPEPVIVTVNRTRIEQILINLVGNARDAIKQDGGMITIRTRIDREQARVVVDVADNGTGMPREVLDKIFVPFFTTKPEDKGTGLGLPVVREIIVSYGGQLAVTSEVDVGSTFTFWLPIDRPA